MPITPKQHQLLNYLNHRQEGGEAAPTLSQICRDLGLKSRGSLLKHVNALITEGEVKPMDRHFPGVRLVQTPLTNELMLPLLGKIAAGNPIEAIEDSQQIGVPAWLNPDGESYVLQVKGESMVDMGIMDGDYVIIRVSDVAANGDVVVALVNGEVTLKRIEQHPDMVILHPENRTMEPLRYHPQEVEIQGVLMGQMRSYQ